MVLNASTTVPMSVKLTPQDGGQTTPHKAEPDRWHARPEASVSTSEERQIHHPARLVGGWESHLTFNASNEADTFRSL